MKRAKPWCTDALCTLPDPAQLGGAGRGRSRLLTCIKAAAPRAPYRASMPALAFARRFQDDLQGLFTGTLFAAFGVFLMQNAGLVPGGTVGLALVGHYTLGLDVGAALFLVNLPFYALAWLRMGRAFTLRSALAVSLLSLWSWGLPRLVEVQQLDGVVAAVLGGLLCGAGILFLFRHGASLGGFNVLALWLQERLGWPAGKVQMGLDAAVVLGGGWMAGDLRRVGLSVLAVVALNLALVYNHRPGRYRAA